MRNKIVVCILSTIMMILCAAKQDDGTLELDIGQRLLNERYSTVIYCNMDELDIYEHGINAYIMDRYTRELMRRAAPRELVELLGNDIREVISATVIDAYKIGKDDDLEKMPESNILDYIDDVGEQHRYMKENKKQHVVIRVDNLLEKLQNGESKGSINHTGVKYKSIPVYSMEVRDEKYGRCFLATQDGSYLVVTNSIYEVTQMLEVNKGEEIGLYGSDYYQQIEDIAKELGIIWEMSLELMVYETVAEKEALEMSESGAGARLEVMRKYEDNIKVRTFILNDESLIDRTMHIFASEEAASMYKHMYSSEKKMNLLLAMGNLNDEEKRAIKESGAGHRVYVEKNILYRDSNYTKELLRHLNKQYQNYQNQQKREKQK